MSDEQTVTGPRFDDAVIAFSFVPPEDMEELGQCWVIHIPDDIREVSIVEANAIKDRLTQHDQLTARIAELEEENEDRPYWMWRAMLEEFGEMDCRCDGPDQCSTQGLCVTEYCLPCAAKCFLRKIREAESPRSEAAKGGG